MPRSGIALAKRIQKIWNDADAENRPLYPEERSEVEDLLDQAESQQQFGKRIGELGLNLGGADFVPTDPNVIQAGSPGRRFVESHGYKSIQDGSTRPQQWTSGPVEVGMLAKGTLLSTPGTALTPPDYRAGVVETLFAPVGIGDLFAQESTTGSQVRYVRESVATNAAAGVAEGAEKPESALSFEEVVEPVRKSATTLPVSDELLEDADAIASYINQRLALFLNIEVDRQLLHGTGNTEVPGLLGRSGVNTYARGTVDSNEVAIFKAANGLRGSAFLDPDTVVINPANWQPIRLATDSSGQYQGGGPFLGPYGQGRQVSTTWQVGGEGLWGLNVFVSPVIGAGTAVVGSFRQAAAVYNRSGVTVEASNSHADYFRRNLNLLRAERRLALGVFRPQAFVKVTGLSS